MRHILQYCLGSSDCRTRPFLLVGSIISTPLLLFPVDLGLISLLLCAFEEVAYTR